MDLNLSLQQKQQLSQTQILSLEILSMDNIELNQFLKNEYLENPLLEHNEIPSSYNMTEPLSSYYENSSPSSFNIHTTTEDEDNSRKDFSAPKENILQDYILTQLDITLYTNKEWELFIYLINCLDDNGFFSMPIEEVAEKTNTSESLIQRSLSILRDLEPYGIFSENLQQSLLHQLDMRI